MSVAAEPMTAETRRATAAGPAVEVVEVAKRFGGTRALDGVSFSVARGSMTGLVGPNGSGKSTTLKCLSGFLQPDAGTIRILGEPAQDASPQELFRRGVAQTFQRLALAEELTVAENVLLANEGQVLPRPRRLLADLVQGRPLVGLDVERIGLALQQTGLLEDADAIVGSLPLGVRRRVELARALVAQPELLLADEPTSGLDARESAEVAAVMSGVARSLELTVVLVEHDLDVLADLCNQLVVLNFGRVIADGPAAAVLDDSEVKRAFLGTGGA